MPGYVKPPVNGRINGATEMVASTASQIPLTVKGASGQSAVLFDIENSAGTTLAYIDSTGRQRLPYQPSFFAKGSEAGWTSTNGGEAPLNIAVYNIGNHFNTSTYRFTAPVTGIYQINANMFNNGGTSRLAIKVNNTVWNNIQATWAAGAHWSMSVTLSLAAGDYVSVGDWQNYAGAVLYMGHSSLSGYLVG